MSDKDEPTEIDRTTRSWEKDLPARQKKISTSSGINTKSLYGPAAIRLGHSEGNPVAGL